MRQKNRLLAEVVAVVAVVADIAVVVVAVAVVAADIAVVVVAVAVVAVVAEAAINHGSAQSPKSRLRLIKPA
jgi:hypothetical protein